MKGRKPSTIASTAGALTKAPAPPAWLSPDAKKEWKRCIRPLIERRILTQSDLGQLENYCIAQGRAREIERTLQAAFSLPLCRAQDKALATARQIAAELGLTPMSRSRPTMIEDDDSEDSSDLAL
ncbi:phage terminase small subunit P27 family [Xanthobacter dioxanivorans]|uniref:Phage terminase small subunit P27 family n=1 Tax=Xanthobacter dioxanivorans TaxID=2528964 RepID=A0A974PS70_9HYPH|nr:phage terminase small subunit P27 family [Xanthobacter dioxanivorans]QRG08803.1 phage terminase small subunit P27 family [Xanthobacter dioxanivorans]